MNLTGTPPTPTVAIVCLSRWLKGLGVSNCTAWRWRKKGWLRTVNIAGRQYLTREAIDEFERRALAGEFAKEAQGAVRKGARA